MRTHADIRRTGLPFWALGLTLILATAGCSQAPKAAPTPAQQATNRQAAAMQMRQKDVARLQSMEAAIQNNPKVPLQIKAQTIAGLSRQIQAQQTGGR